MSIGIEPGVTELDQSASGPLASDAFVAELARMANALFQHGGSPAAGPGGVQLPAGVSPPVPTVGPLLAASPPANPGPSALALGAGGVSTSHNAPPTPGFLSTPPLASSPAPKDSDLRNVGALLADSLHTQPVHLAETPAPSANESAPYFLALAGMRPEAPTQLATPAPVAQLPQTPAPVAPAAAPAAEPLGAPLP